MKQTVITDFYDTRTTQPPPQDATPDLPPPPASPVLDLRDWVYRALPHIIPSSTSVPSSVSTLDLEAIAHHLAFVSEHLKSITDILSGTMTGAEQLRQSDPAQLYTVPHRGKDFSSYSGEGSGGSETGRGRSGVRRGRKATMEHCQCGAGSASEPGEENISVGGSAVVDNSGRASNKGKEREGYLDAGAGRNSTGAFPPSSYRARKPHSTSSSPRTRRSSRRSSQVRQLRVRIGDSHLPSSSRHPTGPQHLAREGTPQVWDAPLPFRSRKRTDDEIRGTVEDDLATCSPHMY
ncbi:uncharacterized protein AB675_5539 [Cyphellophora attinorum]|uniref:Uncharacterized protein n=1 Tax=Cyphellophora attinorum TaxID=1664694 RepID=A0A0N1H742_9EURO|nr:uncharacterized protein AB675_5539 [Phialophora attinorum]KPI42135.1 hypothetical protein AB675_5539 [Phialophora attinorum]